MSIKKQVMYTVMCAVLAFSILSAGAASYDLLRKAAYAITINNDTEVRKAYLVRHHTELQIWINIMDLKPGEIFRTSMIPGTYKFTVADVKYRSDGTPRWHYLESGTFTVTKEQLQDSYVIRLSQYPCDK